MRNAFSIPKISRFVKGVDTNARANAKSFPATAPHVIASEAIFDSGD